MHRPPLHRPRPPASRRRALQALLGMAASGLAGCEPAPRLPLRIGAHPWPGYELMQLARQRGHLDAAPVRLLEMPSASASLRALAAGAIDGAGLTLDEVLGARALGLPLQVVAVLDVSQGADALLARPDLDTLAALRGRRIGVEQSATGAVMLDAALARGGLTPADVRLVPMSADEHARAFLGGQVDALVTFEPVRARLLLQGARQLFSSAEVPGLIVDVLALGHAALAPHGDAVRQLVAGIFRARGDWLADPAACAPLLAPRLNLAAADVATAFARLDLPDLAANHRWLDGPAPALHETAARLAGVMRRAKLLAPAEATADDDARLAASAPLAEGHFLPAA